MERDEGGFVRVDRRQVRCRTHDRLDIPFRLGVLQDARSEVTVQEQLDAAQPALHLANPRHRPRGVEPRRVDDIGVLALAHREDPPILALERGLDSTQGPRAAGANGRGHPRKKNDFP